MWPMHVAHAKAKCMLPQACCLSHITDGGTCKITHERDITKSAPTAAWQVDFCVSLLGCFIIRAPPKLVCTHSNLICLTLGVGTGQ